jgi:hypothetical protein
MARVTATPSADFGTTVNLMDKGGAISRFLERVDTYGQIILITGNEVRELFGEEMMAALNRLESFAEEQRLCADCGGRCCDDIGCELFVSRFGQCPIHSFRPIACRLHFCQRFDNPYKSAIIELRDVFLGCYSAIDLWYSPNIASMDAPPFTPYCPEFISAVAPLVEAVRAGSAAPQDMAHLIMKQASKYRDARITRAADAQ